MKSWEISLAIFSGILLTLIFPKANIEVTAWFSLIPLFLALEKKEPFSSFFLGLTAGFVCYLGLLYWIIVPLTTYGGLPFLFGIFLLLLLASYLGLYLALFSFGVTWLSRKAALQPVITAPFLWVSLEYIKSLILTGFPWENLGYSQFLTLPIIQIADITGVYGVSWLIVFANAVIF